MAIGSPSSGAGWFIRGYFTEAASGATLAPRRWTALWFCSILNGIEDTAAPTVAIPLWFPVLLFLATGTAVLMNGKGKQFGRGFCRQCGYDLRASPDRCPECGTELVERAPADPFGV